MAVKKTKTTADGGVVHISYSILGIGLIVLILVVLVIGFFDHTLRWHIELKDYISICSFGCVTIALIYNAASLQYNFELNKAKFEKDDRASENEKIKITYEAVAEWYKVDMAMNSEIARRFLQPFKGKLNDPAVLTEFKFQLDVEANIQIRKSLISVLNYFEHLSLLSVDNVIDEGILKKAFRTAFTTYYINLKEFIDDEQRGNAGANSKIYINFVGITKKWLYN